MAISSLALQSLAYVILAENIWLKWAGLKFFWLIWAWLNSFGLSKAKPLLGMCGRGLYFCKYMNTAFIPSMFGMLVYRDVTSKLTKKLFVGIGPTF